MEHSATTPPPHANLDAPWRRRRYSRSDGPSAAGSAAACSPWRRSWSLAEGWPCTRRSASTRSRPGSMEPTLQVGQRVAAERSSSPQVGDIVVFHPPAGARAKNPVCGSGLQGTGSTQPCDVPVPQESGAVFVKRVVAGPGDLISIVDGHVVRNGVRENEPYIAPCGAGAACSFPTRGAGAAGRVLPAGRQSRRVRRQPLLGSGAERMDHRNRRALLAARHRLPPGPLNRAALAAAHLAAALSPSSAVSLASSWPRSRPPRRPVDLGRRPGSPACRGSRPRR